MLQILTKTPLFVWPLLAFLIMGGIRARKTNSMPLKVMMAIPVVFTIWNGYALFSRYGVSVLTTSLWILSLGVGITIGMWMMGRLTLRFEKEKKRVEFPGSLIPLFLSLTVFSVRYSLGMTYALHPEFALTGSLIPLELLATCVAGIFVGRFVGCWRRYRAAI